MSKIYLGLAAVALTAFAVIAGSPSRVVHAQSNGAFVLHTCPAGPGEAGFESIGGYEFTFCDDETDATIDIGNFTFHGSLVDPSTAPGHTVIIRGFNCATIEGVTTDSEVIITPSGAVEGSCTAHF